MALILSITPVSIADQMTVIDRETNLLVFRLDSGMGKGVLYLQTNLHSGY